MAGVARTTNGAEAKAAVVEHGTPVRLLQHFYKDVRLVIYNGSECRYVHVPENWESWPERRRKTVVLNVWGNHVFTYDNPQARNPKVKKAYYVKACVQTLVEVEDRNLFHRCANTGLERAAAGLERAQADLLLGDGAHGR